MPRIFKIDNSTVILMSPFQYFYESAVSVQIYALQMFLFYDKYHSQLLLTSLMLRHILFQTDNKKFFLRICLL